MQKCQSIVTWTCFIHKSLGRRDRTISQCKKRQDKRTGQLLNFLNKFIYFFTVFSLNYDENSNIVCSHRTAKMCKIVEGERLIFPCSVESRKRRSVLWDRGNRSAWIIWNSIPTFVFYLSIYQLSTHLQLIVSCIYLYLYLPHGWDLIFGVIQKSTVVKQDLPQTEILHQ